MSSLQQPKEGMVSDDAEHTRFPCLATVRSLLAAVVTALAVAVVVMVIVVLDRPQDFILSMSRGYIQSEQLWWTETEKTIRVRSELRSPRHRPDALLPFARPEYGGAEILPGTVYGLGQVGEEPEVVTVTKHAPATPPVNLLVTWSAYNPSGRGPIDCTVTTIRVFDMPNNSATGMEIGAVSSLKKPLRFSVPSRVTHTQMQRVAINDSDTLQYIYNQYQGTNSFFAMVQVTATSTSKATPIPSATDDSVNYYCWPLTVVHGKPDEGAFAKVSCTTVPPTPSPAPAPAGA